VIVITGTSGLLVILVRVFCLVGLRRLELLNPLLANRRIFLGGHR
jgi:hypothetical protein